jgi:hypothetical protein
LLHSLGILVDVYPIRYQFFHMQSSQTGYFLISKHKIHTFYQCFGAYHKLVLFFWFFSEFYLMSLITVLWTWWEHIQPLLLLHWEWEMTTWACRR